MPVPARAMLTGVVLLVVVFAAARPAGSAAVQAALPLPFAAANLEAEKRKGEQLVQSLHLAEVLGPLAPVALSPFFALTCLSGASLLADSGIPFLSGVQKNAILGTSSPLNNGFVFAGLLILTVVTAMPKLTKVSKPFGQAVDQIEAHAGIISIIAVQSLSTLQLGDTPAPAATIIVQAGIFSFTGDVLVAVFSAINIFVVNTVKFFFEVMVWLSPFPAVDAMFEAANKAVAALLLAIYLWSPATAMVLNLIIFAVCLVIFTWVYRRVVYMRSVLGDPIMGWFSETVFRRRPATLTSTPLPSSVAARLPQPTLVLKAFAGNAHDAVPRKSRGLLVQSEGRLAFVRARLFRSAVLLPLPQQGHRAEVSKGLLSNSILILNDGGSAAATFIITRRYNCLLDAIRACVGATASAPEPSRASEANRPLTATREIGAAIRGSDVRGEVRADFA